MGFDANCFVGNWPFFRVKENTFEKLKELHSKNNITGGFVSSLESIFYQDPYEAESLLSQQIKDSGYQQIMVLNPMLPAWKNDLVNAVQKLGVSGVRLIPGFHGYNLLNEGVSEVVSFVRDNDLRFMITLRMQDDRTVWMHKPQTVSMEEIAGFLKKHKDIAVILNNIHLHEIDQLHSLGVNWENVYVDTSGFKGGVNPVETALSKKFLKGHIVYGSGAPLLEIYATVFQLEMADADAVEKEQVFSCEKYFTDK